MLGARYRAGITAQSRKPIIKLFQSWGWSPS
jgi:hypothetical protein